MSLLHTDEKPATQAARSNPTELAYRLPDGTVIKIYPPRPLTVEEGYRESCRWAERLEVFLHPDQQFAPAQFGLGEKSGDNRAY